MNKTGLSALTTAFGTKFPQSIEMAAPDCLFNRRRSCFTGYCRLVASHPDGYEKCVAHRRLALRTAMETGQKNIVLCHAGLITCVFPVVEGGRLTGGAFMGKVRIKAEGEDENDPMPQGVAPWVPRPPLEKAWAQIPVVTPSQFREAAEFFVQQVKTHLGDGEAVLRPRYVKNRQQEEIAQVIHRGKKENKPASYSFPLERELTARVHSGDRTESTRLLNEILAGVLMAHGGNLALIKARVLEMLIVISRAGVEGARDPEAVFAINQDHAGRIVKAGDAAEVCLIAGEALDGFLNLAVKENSETRHQGLRAALNHIANHLDEKISLEETAAVAHLSPWRLSHLFRERLSTTFADHVSRLRVERARELLLTQGLSATEAAYRSGFSDQSYFTKVFKKVTGVTPKRFQMENGRRKGWMH